MNSALTSIVRSVTLLDQYHYNLNAFLQAGWIIIETKKQRIATPDEEAFYDNLEFILGAPAGVDVPEAVKNAQESGPVMIYDE